MTYLTYLGNKYNNVFLSVSGILTSRIRSALRSWPIFPGTDRKNSYYFIIIVIVVTVVISETKILAVLESREEF